MRSQEGGVHRNQKLWWERLGALPKGRLSVCLSLVLEGLRDIWVHPVPRWKVRTSRLLPSQPVSFSRGILPGHGRFRWC